MPRLTDSVPKYRRHRASGQAVVTLKGRDHYLGNYGTKASRVEYDRLIGEWLASGRQPALEAAADLTIAELVARYMRHAKSYYRKDGKLTSEVGAIKTALRFVRLHYSRTPAAEFGPLALKAVRTRMVEDGKARSTTNQSVQRIRRMFKWAVSEQLLPPSVYEALKSVDGLRRGKTKARETKPVLPIDDAIVDATLPHLPEVVADMLRLQRLTGMRPSEVCALRPMDLDRTDDCWLYVPQSHKTEHHGRHRCIFIGPRGQDVLLKYLARDPGMHCFRPADSEAKRRAQQHAERKTPLSCGDRPGTNRKRKPKRRPGEQYNTNSLNRAIRRACDDNGIERWSSNRLRHSAATEIRRQFGLESAQVALGHSQLSTTQIYAERDNSKGIEVARAIG